MAWMALGGTDKQIPANLLSIVATTPVLGTRRGHATEGSPNMLDLAQQLCEFVLPANPNSGRPTLDNLLFKYGTLDLSRDVTYLIGTNGDAENWMRLCSLNNRQVVRALTPWVTSWSLVTDPGKMAISPINLYWGDAYPATAQVLDHRGHVVTGLTKDNLFPMCVLRPTDPNDAALADAFLAANPINGSTIPYCPTQILKDQLKYDTPSTGIVYTDAIDWAVRGAINAGLGVFLYVDGISKGTIVPKPAYNQCEQLGAWGTH